MVIGLDVVGSFARFLEAMLLAKGFTLVHTPGSSSTAPVRASPARAKSDPRDARTIAELVRTCDLRRILPDDDNRIALRLKVGRRRERIEDQTRRLACLRHSWPTT
ncbi:transposase for insertion sequence NGRIS-14b (plasmid) [Sinorhizobium americanum CCGM7]|uniref:IS110 family transposase n=1 Tax=Sinorhizobium americanum TaxID=194963 RepID=UPI0004D72E7C|nr:transposase [Sinorhizobium americanum]APG88524.1 transposase for insertion sequence NGRIS-14b [Sinorhizobium americanum CCGM7]